MNLYLKVLIGIFLGIILGLYFPGHGDIIGIPGIIFMKIIKLLIPFLIIGYLITGISSIDHNVSILSIGLRILLVYVCATIFAVCFGLGIGLILQPGIGNNIIISSQASDSPFNLYDFIINIFPNNMMELFMNYESHPIQLVIAGIFLGVMIIKQNSIVLNVKQILKLVVFMVSSIIDFSHYAAFSLIYVLVEKSGGDMIITLSYLIFSILLAMLLMYLLYGFSIYFFSGLSPYPFFKKSIKYQLIALSTSSSKVTLPTTIDVCKNDLGISYYNHSFTLPLGASINMSASSITLSITTLFFANLAGLDLSLYQYLIIIFLSVIMSIGTAGIPADILIALPPILAAIELPVESIGMLVGIDRILDAFRTLINITGDAAITLILDVRDGKLDKEKYYS